MQCCISRFWCISRFQDFKILSLIQDCKSFLFQDFEFDSRFQDFNMILFQDFAIFQDFKIVIFQDFEFISRFQDRDISRFWAYFKISRACYFKILNLIQDFKISRFQDFKIGKHISRISSFSRFQDVFTSWIKLNSNVHA